MITYFITLWDALLSYFYSDNLSDISPYLICNDPDGSIQNSIIKIEKTIDLENAQKLFYKITRINLETGYSVTAIIKYLEKEIKKIEEKFSNGERYVDDIILSHNLRTILETYKKYKILKEKKELLEWQILKTNIEKPNNFKKILSQLDSSSNSFNLF